MRRWLTAYLATGLAMIAMDAIWLTRSIGFYRSRIGALLLDQPRLAPAAVFYLLYAAALTAFATWPGLQRRSPRAAAARGALFGLTAYATYDLTNLATLKAFSLDVAVVDMGWGLVLSSISAALGCLIAKIIFRDHQLSI